MERSRAGVYVMVLQGAVLLAGLFAAASTAPDDKTKRKTDQPGRLIHSLKGPDIYRAHCASCHGSEGKSDGPVAAAITAKMPDLSTIAHRNGGIFPTSRVRKIIVGDEVILGHGSREMPIWGPIFHQVEADRDYGEVRLQNITDYLKSIQK
ncbi:MAG TPA: c-type cytochrome [Candidatus Dormibacteraeota bacterium]|nr:c-type cytochrome [Candidatus Dormibacteraeota bacterium]